MREYVIAALLGYMLGCSNMAFYIGRRKKVDMRRSGTGNLGAANALTLMGWKAGVMVGAHDIGKAVAAVLLAKWLFPEQTLVGSTAGVACVLGHIYPFYLRFRGGKGFAAYLGMVAALNWKFSLGLAVAVVLLTLITDYVVVGTVAAVVSYPAYIGWRTGSWIQVMLLCVATTAVLWKHRKNYVRIWNGTETGLRGASRGDYRAS